MTIGCCNGPPPRAAPPRPARHVRDHSSAPPRRSDTQASGTRRRPWTHPRVPCVSQSVSRVPPGVGNRGGRGNSVWASPAHRILYTPTARGMTAPPFTTELGGECALGWHRLLGLEKMPGEDGRCPLSPSVPRQPHVLHPAYFQTHVPHVCPSTRSPARPPAYAVRVPAAHAFDKICKASINGLEQKRDWEKKKIGPVPSPLFPHTQPAAAPPARGGQVALWQLTALPWMDRQWTVCGPAWLRLL